MRRRVSAHFGKTVADLSAPKWLLAYLVSFGFIAGLLGLAIGDGVMVDIGQLPLELQEELLMAGFLPLVFFWGVGLPLLVAGAVFGSLTLATEAERGTLAMILSKPVRRLEVFVSSFLATVVFLTALGVAGMALVAAILVTFSSVAPAAIEAGIIELVPVTIAFALVVSIFMAGMTHAVGVLTRSRLQTVLVSLLAPVLFLVPWFVGVISPGNYTDYRIYLVDMGYHLGHVYDLLTDTFGLDLPATAKDSLSTFSGIYEPAGTTENPPHESLETTAVEYAGHLEPMESVVILAGVLLIVLAVAIVRFRRMDI